ncbi:MAG: glycosyltransferase [Dehalococcoidia bacterium]|nr:glycosyltransferase [Dehalococcoidia bacterium]
MTRVNLHIYGSPITHESRILRETETISKLGIVDKIYIIGLWAKGLPMEESLDDERTILRVKLLSAKLGEGTLAKSIKLAEWMARIALRFLTKRVVMVNVDYLAGLPLGVFFKVFKRSKLVYDTSELETERNGWGAGRKKLAKIVERGLINVVDQTIVSSPSYADWYEKAYGKRPAVVLNAPKYTAVARQDIFRGKFNISGDKVIFLYQGALGKGRSIESIVEAFIQTADKGKVVVFMGYGPMEEAVREAAKEHANIFFHPAVKPEDVLEYTAAADIGFCLIENTCLSYCYTLPNKMLEYAMVGLPIVVANFGEMRRLIETHKVGYVLQDSTAKGIGELIARVNKAELQTFKENLAEFSKVYNWENQEKVLAQVYRKYQFAAK